MKGKAAAALLVSATLAVARPLTARGLINDAAGQTYDYIVVGCGVSGLVVSSRLSENEDVTVLCLEAGSLDHYEDEIMIPYYIGLQPYGFYEWGIYTAPQTQLDGVSRHIPMGKGVGGSSLINGMVWNRGNQRSFNAWNDVGNSGWGWNALLPYFEKSETYTPKNYDGAEVQPELQNPSVHGNSGPLQVSYPNYYWPQTDNWFAALHELGIPTSAEPNEGLSAGGYFLPLDIDPNNQTRSDARRSYYDPNIARDNFNVQANSQVTRVLFEQGDQLRATGVEFATGPSSPRQTAYASREVILAAGAIHSPQLLELSGIGQASVLEAVGVQVLENLPGVGNNLQDHGMIHLDYAYTNPSVLDISDFASNSTFNDESAAEYFGSKTGPWTAKPSCAVAFPSLQQVNDDAASMLASASAAPYNLPSTYNDEPTLQSGYERQIASVLDELANEDIPAFENLNNNAGGLDLALMRPLSRGTTHITSTDPFASPSVDPRWLAHQFDYDVMILAMQVNQRILDTAAIQELQPSYSQVPQDATVDELGQILRSGIGTEYHYSCTTAMLPRELGGVVDDQLRVYGTSNLRIVDTGIYPMVPGAHLQAVAYGVAEKAADLIKAAQ
ncbi:Dehydrogenase xptC [Exophiala dermatitidis]